MDGLIVLAVIFGLLIFIGIPYALISLSGLRAQVGRLEKEVYGLSRRLSAAVSDAASEVASDAPASEDRATPAQKTPKAEAPQKAAALTSEDPPRPDAHPAAAAMRTEGLTVREARALESQRKSGPPKAFVFDDSKFSALSAWLKENWVLAVAAASLAFAGIFMVQYGVEHGVLTPFWRVMAALGFGAVLVAAGEVMRRRFGDESEGAAQYLPSTLSGAGIITLFAGVLSAKLLYGLIGSNTALAGLVAVSVFAMILGWFYGPFMAAIGVIGAMAAPFTLSTGAGAPDILYYYFGLIAIMALGIDTIKRWAWVSVLGLVLGFAAIWLLFVGDTGALHFLGSTFVVALAAVIIPQRSLVPSHAGAALSDVLMATKGEATFPEFPTRLSAGALLFATYASFAVLMGAGNVAEEWLGLGALIVLASGAALWMARAPALFDHPLPPALGFLLALLALGQGGSYLVSEVTTGLRTSAEVDPPQVGYILYTLVGFGAFLSLLAFWRMRGAALGAARAGEPMIWAVSAAVLAPASFLILEFLWPASQVIGAYPWALTAIALAAFMTVLAERTVAAGGEAVKARAGLMALAALTLIAMALFLVLSKTALSLALAAMVLGIVVLDKRINLPALGWFVQLGLAVITYRLIADPGLYWAVEQSSALEAAVAYGGVLGFLAAAWLLLDGQERLSTRLAIESTGMLVALAGVMVVFARVLEDNMFSHWGMGLLATLWGAALLAQLYRLRGTELAVHRGVRYVLMALFGLLAGLSLVAQATVFNPLMGGFMSSEKVAGPILFDSLALAYLPVAALFALAAWKFTKPDGMRRKVLVIFASFYGVTYVAFEIRRLFRGRDLSVYGVTDGELYAYTVAMLVGAGLLLMLAFSRRSVTLRKIAMGLVAVTIAKVFLVDMSGLSGLTRVFSFMGLGLALLGLTWVNRLMTAQWEKGAAAEPELSEDRD